MPVLGRPRRSVSDRINPIGSIAADGEYSIRWGRFHPIRRGAESSRPGVSPHRQQASVRSSARPCRNTCGIPTTHTFCPVTNTFRPIAPIPSNLARNSPAAPSNIEFASLELQRFRMVSKNYRLKLCAKFVWAGPAFARRRRGQAPSQGLAVLTGPSGPGECRIVGGGFAPLGASCRRVAPLMVQFPRLVVWSRFEVMSRPTCRPPRRKMPTMGSRGRGRLRWQHNDAWRGVLVARSPLRCEREPAIACGNQLFRTSTRYSVSGRGCPRSHQRVNVRMRRPRLVLAG